MTLFWYFWPIVLSELLTNNKQLHDSYLFLQADGNDKRIIKQFQFTAWPDPEVPNNPGPLLGFIRRVRKENDPASGPMIVHCRYNSIKDIIVTFHVSLL